MVALNNVEKNPPTDGWTDGWGSYRSARRIVMILLTIKQTQLQESQKDNSQVNNFNNYKLIISWPVNKCVL